MPSAAAEALAVTLAALGWISAVVSCSLPMWKVSAYVGLNRFSQEIRWEGIWMTCLHQSTGHVQCQTFYPLLALSASHQAARALTVASIVAGTLGLLTASAGAKCTRCVGEKAAKARATTAAGWIFVLAALAQIIPVSWYAHSVIVDFHDPGVPEEKKRDMGAALYLGWAAGALLLAGGVVLCCSRSKAAEGRSAPPSAAAYARDRSTSPSAYVKQDFV